MEQLEGMIGTLRVYTSRLATKESYWIFHKDGDDFDLKVSDPKSPSYLLIAMAVKYTSMGDVWAEITEREQPKANKAEIARSAMKRWKRSGKAGAF